MTVLALALGFGYALGSRSDLLDRQRASVDAMTRILGSDASIVSISAPQALALAEMRNPTRHQLVSGPLGANIKESWPGGLGGFRQWVVRQHPDLIAIGNQGPRSWGRIFRHDYQPVGRAPTWTWYASRDLDPQTLQSLLAADVGRGGGGG